MSWCCLVCGDGGAGKPLTYSCCEMAKARADATRLRAFLRTIEWGGDSEIDYEVTRPCCPCCGGLESSVSKSENYFERTVGHAADCPMPGMLVDPATASTIPAPAEDDTP